MTEPLNLDEIKPWLTQCGSCDAGLPTACTCPQGDPRAIISRLVAEIERLRAAAVERPARRPTRRVSGPLNRCFWCRKDRRRMSEWEQESLRNGWQRLCVPCANRRLGNPYNALLPMRKVEAS